MNDFKRFVVCAIGPLPWTVILACGHMMRVKRKARPEGGDLYTCGECRREAER